MIILSYKYKTSLTTEDIKDWVENKSNEKTGIFKVKRFRARLTNDGFRIRERRFNQYQAFFPQIIGKYGLDKRTVDIKIRPSLLGMIFFGVFWLLAPIAVFTMDEATINGTLRTLDFADRLSAIGSLMLFLIPMTLILLIWPNFKARNWIEVELELTDRQKSNS